MATAGFVALAALLLVRAEANPGQRVAPPSLQETGLYSDFALLEVDARHIAFSPQYPLWTDGATKQRWISLPPGAAINGSDPDAWVFPVGTRLWKEFSFAGQRVETRYLERQPNGEWLYATYAWSDDGREAMLVSPRGRRNAFRLGERAHTIPSLPDCKACHQGGRSEVLGFGALQLSSARDPRAPHAEAESGIDLAALIENGLLIGYGGATMPRIASRSATERAAIGYLHGNCGHCHNADGPLANVGLHLRHDLEPARAAAIATTVGVPVRKLPPGASADATLRIDAQHPERSLLLQRLASRYAPLQMPPLGTELVDHDAVALIRRWIAETEELAAAHPQPETQP